MNLYEFIKNLIIKYEPDAENDFQDFEDFWNKIMP